MMWYAGVEVTGAAEATAQSTAFTLLHNETLESGRYVPNYDEDDAKNDIMTLLYPNFVFLPVLTNKGAALNFGDNRLADLQARVQHALAHMPTIKADATHMSALPPFLLSTSAFPFEKPTCDGSGCVMMYIMPQLIAWVFMVTLQALLTAIGREKERSIKESLLLSGMSQWAYFGSWLCSKLIDAIPPCIVWVGGAYALRCIEHQYFLPVLAVTYLYALQIIAFALCVQTFFKTQQSMFMGSIMCLLVVSLCYYPIRLLGIDKEGADLEACHDWAPSLAIAASEGFLDVVKLLLAKGAMLHARDVDARTALMCAANKGHPDVVEFLLRPSQDLELQDRDGSTALHLCCNAPGEFEGGVLAKRRAETMHCLVRRGVNVEAADRFGNTALHVCAISDNTSCSKILVGYGADLGAVNRAKQTPADTGRHYKHIKFTKWINGVLRILYERRKSAEREAQQKMWELDQQQMK